MRWIAGLGIAALAGIWAGAAEGQAPDEAPCIEDRSVFMMMDYWTFDQTPEGVRSVSSRPECYLAAADLTRDYHDMLRQRGEPVTHEYEGQTITMSEDGEMSILYWHEGQLRAFAGETQAAATLFRQALKPPEKSYMGWNQYALASTAFLEDDLDELKAQRAALAARIPVSSLNLEVVDGLIACFERSYADAYGAQECNRRSSPDLEGD